MSSCRYVAIYRIKKNKLCPTVRMRHWYGSTNKCAKLYYGWSGWRDCGNNPLCQSQVNSFLEMFLHAGDFIRNKEVLNVRLAINEAPGVDLRRNNCPLRKRWLPFYFTVIWEPNETLLCTSEVGDYGELTIGTRRAINCTSLCCPTWWTALAFSNSVPRWPHKL